MTRVNSIQVMQACYDTGHTYKEYLAVSSKFGVYPHSKESYEYHCKIWDEKWW